MSKVYPFDFDKTNAPYILPDGRVDYPFDIDYSGHGHPSATAFMAQYTNPSRTEAERQYDLERLTQIRQSKNGWRFLPRAHHMGEALLSFMLRFNSGQQTMLDVLEVPFDDSSIKEVLVRAMGWSAIERFPHHTITTAVTNPNETFFDYRLMGYHINQVPQLVWNEERKEYTSYTTPSYLLPESEHDATEELELLDKALSLPEWWPDTFYVRECIHASGCEDCEIDHRWHIINNKNFISRQLAKRAVFFKNDREYTDGFAWPQQRVTKSMPPLAAIGVTDIPYSNEIVFSETAKRFGITSVDRIRRLEGAMRTIDDEM